MPSRKISPQMLLANLEKLRKEVGQNPAYQAYLNSVADLEAKLRILHEPDRFGRIRLMSAEDKTELMKLSLAVGQQAADAEKAVPQMPKGTAELMEKIGDLAYGLYETAAAYDPKQPQSISMLMEDMRTLTLDVRNTPMKGSLSGAVSQRQPLSFLDRKGREISGVFTAKREMKVWDALNRDLEESCLLDLDLRSFAPLKMQEHIVLHHDDVQAVNTEENPNEVVPSSLPVVPVEGGRAQVVLPPLSWNVLRFA